MKYKPNDIQIDEFGRPNGILLVDKPVGITSHDVVDQIRKKYNTRKVGHSGALDPFASGLLVILIGKATKLSNEFLNLDKSYEMRVLFGISTDSGDTEGEILRIENPKIQKGKKEIEAALASFEPEYEQYVPVYSSVKVDGEKLRKLARRFDSFRIVAGSESLVTSEEQEGKPETRNTSLETKLVEFYDESGEVVHTVELPKREVKISETEILGSGVLKHSDIGDFGESIEQGEYQYVDISLSCSKGTYVRQLAIDLGEKLGVPAMLTELRRTRVGEFTVADAAEV